MLSSLKKPSDKLSAVTMPAWHPNFRIPERLPDTKAVRTSFFINGLAIFIVMALLVYAGVREYNLYTLRSDAASALSAVEARKPVSDRAIVLYKNFQEEEKKILALQDFLSVSRYTVSDFILQLGGSLPAAINLYGIDCTSTQVVLRGAIKGTPDEASGRAVAFVEDLRKDESLSKLFSSVTLTNIARDSSTGLIQFVIDLKVKEPAKGSSGGKK
jgi:hypothetical protein